MFDPVAMCRVAGIAQGAVNQRDIVLVFGQDGDRNAVTPVQIAVLATTLGTSVWTQILLREKQSSTACGGVRDLRVKIVTGIKFRPRFGSKSTDFNDLLAPEADSRMIIAVCKRSRQQTMASYSTNEFRAGLRIIIDNDPCIIVDNEFVKPGKGQAFNRVRIRNLKTGKTVDKTFKSGESVEAADVMDTDMQYLYTDGEFWHFMVPDTFEQYAADAEAVGDAKDWISDGDICQITLWNNSPLLVEPPNFVELEITETDPGVKGDTASGGVKPATLSTGAVVRVPLFVDQGEIIKVDTRSREYVARVK